VVVRLVAVDSTRGRERLSGCAGIGARGRCRPRGPSFRGGAPSSAYTVNGGHNHSQGCRKEQSLEFLIRCLTFMYLPTTARPRRSRMTLGIGSGSSRPVFHSRVDCIRPANFALRCEDAGALTDFPRWRSIVALFCEYEND